MHDHPRGAPTIRQTSTASMASTPNIASQSRFEKGGTPGIGTERIVRTSESATFASRRSRSAFDKGWAKVVESR